MPIIDSQVHAYERNTPSKPWAGFLHGPPEVTGDDMVAAMDAVGVDGALLVSPYAMYRHDGSYAQLVYAKHPTRFGLIKPVDPGDPAVADVIADWKAQPGTVGVRIMLNREGMPTDPADAGLNRTLAAGARHGFPVNDRLRTVSREPALMYAACCTGVFSDSSTISHCEPDHAPWQPSASAAAIC